jgi:hypothetical protein
MRIRLLGIGLMTLGLVGCCHCPHHERHEGKLEDDEKSEKAEKGDQPEKAEKDEADEGNEVKITFDQAPAAVQATITAQAAGAKVATLDKEADAGKTVYEADAMIGGQNHEIRVAEDGTLISNAPDNEADEKPAAAGEKEEKGGDKDKD